MKSGMGYQRRLGITTNKDVGIKEKKKKMIQKKALDWTESWDRRILGRAEGEKKKGGQKQWDARGSYLLSCGGRDKRATGEGGRARSRERERGWEWTVPCGCANSGNLRWVPG
jgi:hypothetical protein